MNVPLNFPFCLESSRIYIVLAETPIGDYIEIPIGTCANKNLEFLLGQFPILDLISTVT